GVRSGVTSAINSIVTAANAARANSPNINSSGSFGSGTSSSSYLNPRNGFGTGFRPFGFAEGGISTFNRPTLGVLGEKPGYNEMMIPFRKSEGIEAALSRLGL